MTTREGIFCAFFYVKVVTGRTFPNFQLFLDKIAAAQFLRILNKIQLSIAPPSRFPKLHCRHVGQVQEQGQRVTFKCPAHFVIAVMVAVCAHVPADCRRFLVGQFHAQALQQEQAFFAVAQRQAAVVVYS